MASRSFKPASYLASAAQAAPNRSPRPSFTRTSSASSTGSEDSLLATLRSMKIVDKGGESSTAVFFSSIVAGLQLCPSLPKSVWSASWPASTQREWRYTTTTLRCTALHYPAATYASQRLGKGDWGGSGIHEDGCRSGYRADANFSYQIDNHSSSSSLSRQLREETPGRKRSQPIAIELPHKEQVYTPLSARGDLPGGYFPNYEDVPRIYRSHPFGETKSKSESPITSASSSLMSSPASETTPRGGPGLMSPAFGPLSPSIPEPLVKPMGKYHPANYKSPANTQVSTPTSAPRLLPPTNLSMPTTNKRNTRDRPAHGHERKNSDIKRKLQQYQKDMIAQARSAASSSIAGTMRGERKEPNSPKLQPAGSPGPITPFELEDLDNEGYIDAGHRARQALDRDRQNTMNTLQNFNS
ncbi:uncharacterized protein LY89DRAFT_677052 [Mollisia scopiformis]|uniref:Uncharacterized protein n=1 Tax=Mollisia scopiformis TaxID=149040 RepID=A0A132B7D8_MOLSC|nr:uncharacterized protein LY89DRAFT_677052 [Mollisia scopiformis]KUJ08163.1 hypothetical protein LY89DRAFT_677052 [Mollisia scopiformis]